MMFPMLTIGSSMKPTMGRVGFTMSKKFPKYEVGDIIELLTHDKKLHLHRIIRIDDQFVTTKGDNFSGSKDYEINVPIKNIRGKVIWWFP